MPDHLDIESQLILYLAGELPEAERARLEGLLGQDATLRGQLATLSAAMECADSAMHAADESDPAADSRFDAAVRQTSRAIRQWQVDRLARRPSVSQGRRTWRLDWRAYTAATAAAIILLIGGTVWWQMSDNSNDKVPPQYATSEDDTNEELATTIELSMLPPAARMPDFDRVEQQMDNLEYLSGLTRAGKPETEMQ